MKQDKAFMEWKRAQSSFCGDQLCKVASFLLRVRSYRLFLFDTVN